jgi:hypothetical protein
MPGSLIASLAPQTRWTLVIVMAVTLWIGLVAIARRGLSSAADVALGAGTLRLDALLLAPRVRLANLAFPVNLLLWSRMLRRPTADPRPIVARTRPMCAPASGSPQPDGVHPFTPLAGWTAASLGFGPHGCVFARIRR